MTEPTHRLDHDRTARVGMPEAVLCEGKQDRHLRAILDEVVARGAPMLLTRLPVEQVARMGLASLDGFVHDEESETATVHGGLPARPGLVAVVAAGTSDLRVATEVVQTLRFTGVRVEEHNDVGVAGVHRLLDRMDQIRAADVVVVVAGMDAALASVMGGLVASPVVAVPTSVGYGVAAGGTTALHAMLASCAQGVVVTNVDNGFGAACAAVRMLGVAATAAPRDAAEAAT